MAPRIIPLLASAAVGVSGLHGYALTGSHWFSSTITMQLQLGTGNSPLIDGSTSWGASAEDALSTWNNQIGATRFTVVRDSTATIAEGNGLNNVCFSKDVYGQAWGSGVLAVTLTYTSGSSQSVECDVLFNQNLSWNSYRGALQYGTSGAVYDFHRVAMHEFGHVLGLDHPDQAGQTVVAIMNSRISNLDTLATDDITGAQSLYGANTALVTAPTITTQPASQSVNLGGTVTLTAIVNGTPTPTFQWYKNSVSLSGATSSTLKIATAQTTDAGTYTLRATNSGGTVTSTGAVIVVNTPPAIITAPASQTVADGGQIKLSVGGSGSPAPAYQWQKNGVNINGATQSTYVITTATPTDAGTYDVVLTNAAGTTTTVPVLVTVNYSQLVNLSTRGFVPAGGALTAGFVLRGSGDKALVVRGVGPTLNDFGVSNALVDPQLSVIAQSTSQTLASNDGWSVTPQLSTAFQTVGAFSLPSGSADSASELRVVPGAYTARVVSASSNAGVALAEIYDAESSSVRSRLINLSALGYTGSGDSVLVAGFSIQGNAAKRLLVRAVGPTLTSYNVSGTLPDPRLDLYPEKQTTPMAGNDNWGGTADLKNAFTAAGAFPLPDTSTDAAVIVTLQPGNYTVVVSGVNGSTGYALVELYDLDP